MHRKNHNVRGFTLVELILVMAMLLIAAGLIYPTLQGFFRGRVLDVEARRLLALTRYGQSRAVSEGIPMVLWMDPKEGSYGLAAATGYVTEDSREKEFKVDDDLSLEVSEAMIRSRTMGTLASVSVMATKALQPATLTGRRLSRGASTIEFLPDGYLGDSSPEYIAIKERDVETVWLVQDTNRLSYAISSQAPQPSRR